jgi:hypothetical protein
MAVARNGFRPVRTPDTHWVRSVPVGSGGQPVAVGDAVNMIGGLCFACTAGTNPTTGGYGVVLGVYTTAGRPLTHQSTKFIASGNVGRADVCYDPHMEYFVQCVTSVGPSNIGTNVAIEASAANARTGISGMSVDLVASASTNELFKIVALGPLDPATLTGSYSQGWQGGGANNGVTVAWNRHMLNSPTANTQ